MRLPKIHWFGGIILLLALCSKAYGQALIVVDAQIGDVGCDLRDALNSAQSNSNLVDVACISGLDGGTDVIVFDQSLFQTQQNDIALSYELNRSICDDPTFFELISSNVHILASSSDRKVELFVNNGDSGLPCRHFEVTFGGTLELSNIVLSGGISTAGGSISVKEGGNLIIRSSRFERNSASNLGGAIAMTRANAKISNTSFIENSARRGFANLLPNGGAIASFNTQLTVDDSVFKGNRAFTTATVASGDTYGLAGAMALDASDQSFVTQLTRVSMVENQAADSGGAVRMRGGSLQIRDSTLSRNSVNSVVSAGGSAISLIGNNNRLDVINTTITQNMNANGFNGAISISPDNGADAMETTNVAIRNSIIINNTSFNGASGSEITVNELRENDTVVIDNSLIGENTKTLTQGVRSDDAIFILEVLQPELNNLFGFSDRADLQFEEILKPLKMVAKSDGKISQDVHELAPSSPAIDRAVEFVLGGLGDLFRFEGCRELDLFSVGAFRDDQLSLSRPVGGACDLGAVEYREREEGFCFPVVAVNKAVAVVCL